ncbi:MAG: hypothetical protein J7K84_04305 [Deltaproteobacteria bacterium]|nr:hypothetical protein [Deltaproteobacteria bacterium]
MSYFRYPRYVSVAEKTAKAAKKLKQLKKKNPDIMPVYIEGRTIASTWWGKSWNRNLERYADYSNRIGRGRSYVRHGAVLDLRIEPGKVESLVQGSRARPYTVSIKIRPINKKTWQNIVSACKGKLESFEELLAGKFPKALSEIFMAQGVGLFPSPEEIEFDCSCPDWADMCKHVAATLYGISARLDENPGLFFSLRKVAMKDLVAQAVKDESRKLLAKAGKKSKRVIKEADIEDLFGIDMDDAPFSAGKKETEKKEISTAKGSAGKKLSSAAKKSTAKNKKTTSRTIKKKGAKKSPFDMVAGVIRRSKKGVNVAMIKEKTGIEEQQIRNFINRAKRQGKIKNKARGVYISSGRKLQT